MNLKGLLKFIRLSYKKVIKRLKNNKNNYTYIILRVFFKIKAKACCEHKSIVFMSTYNIYRKTAIFMSFNGSKK